MLTHPELRPVEDETTNKSDKGGVPTCRLDYSPKAPLYADEEEGNL